MMKQQLKQKSAFLKISGISVLLVLGIAAVLFNGYVQRTADKTDNRLLVSAQFLPNIRLSSGWLYLRSYEDHISIFCPNVLYNDTNLDGSTKPPVVGKILNKNDPACRYVLHSGHGIPFSQIEAPSIGIVQYNPTAQALNYALSGIITLGASFGLYRTLGRSVS